MEIENSPTPDVLCANCGHERVLHHANRCDGNLGAEHAYWQAFEELPGYDQTRESIDALERAEPRPCPCPAPIIKPAP